MLNPKPQSVGPTVKGTPSTDTAGPVEEDAKTQKEKELNSEELMMREAQELPVCRKSPAK